MPNFVNFSTHKIYASKTVLSLGSHLKTQEPYFIKWITSGKPLVGLKKSPGLNLRSQLSHTLYHLSVATLYVYLGGHLPHFLDAQEAFLDILVLQFYQFWGQGI